MRAGGCKIALIGGGPRALSALIALDAAIDSVGGLPGPVEVTVWEQGRPGPGAVWQTDQPEHLLLNIDAQTIDFSCRVVPSTYPRWALDRGHRAIGFAPRFLTGHYLAWAWDCVEVSSHLDVERRHERVTQISSGDSSERRWQVASAQGSSYFDAVLICSGHADSGAIDHRALADSTRDAGPGTTVHVKGAALTGIDVVLTLTQGRGGSWSEAAQAGVVYRASGKEPDRIVLHSRGGELLAPKPIHVSDSIVRALCRHRAQLAQAEPLSQAWWEVIVEAAVRAAQTQGHWFDRDQAWAVIDRDSTLPPNAVEAVTRLRADLRRAEGAIDSDPTWWLGRAWSALYADIVISLERRPRDQESWEIWRRRAARFERWSFGPPIETVRKLLALIDGGLLQIEVGGLPTDEHRSGDDYWVDAVIAGPGILRKPRGWHQAAPDPASAHDGLWQGLLQAGHVTVRPGERGVLTAPDATCLSVDGEPSPGLAAVGRPTEDPVIGHDSLNRNLHHDIGRWADQTVARLLGTASKPATHDEGDPLR